MTLRPYRHGCVRVSTGTWPFRRWLIVDPTGYAIAGNANQYEGVGARMLQAGRAYFTRR